MMLMQEGQQPGWVFKPGGDNGDRSQETAELPPVVVPAQAPASTPAPVVQQPQVVPSQPVQEAAAPQQPASTFTEGEDHITWTASEYIASPKTAGWYTLLAIGSVILAVIVYFITKEVIPTVVIAILGIIVGIFAARQPQTLQYAIDTSGIHIGDRHYPYASFKAFSIAHEHAIGFIQLLPLKRFMPPLVIHYAPEDEENIADVLAMYLPFEEHKADMVDNLTRRLRF